MTGVAPVLQANGLCKSYAAPVLLEVSLALRAGEVHALVGENGAGKSTFSRILAGLTAPDTGTMSLRGQAYAPRTKGEAERRGVRMVLQELNLIGNLTVAESVLLGHWPHRFGWIDRRSLQARSRSILQQVGLGDLDPRRLVKTLGIGQQQLVEIAAGLSQRCDLLILDEPTAALTDPEIDLLFGQIERLKRAGTAILYISHRLEEIQRIGDRISVLRDGQLVATRAAHEVSLDDIVRLMVGRDLEQLVHRSARPPGPVALRVAGLRREPAVQEASFEVRAGEILGFAGLMGCGRTETMRAVFGADAADAGDLFLYGSAQPTRIRSPRTAIRNGLALLTENRKEQGLLLPLPIRANITLMCLRPLSVLGGWLAPKRERAAAEHWTRTLGVRCRSTEQRTAELSGGNQQKVVIAKWLFRDCRILIVDEPTRGIDVGARLEIYRLLDDLAAHGKAIILVSSDLKELLALCDRIAVMSAGRLTATFARGEWTQERIMAAALSGYRKAK